MMKIIATILSFITIKANATNYYVSNAGNDSNIGTTTGTSWLTCAKVNSTVTSGDSVFFKKGDVWNERIIPASGYIYYGSYGTGARPIITALQTITGFTQNGNIWTKNIPNAPASLNTVLIDGAKRAKGRYPNSGYILTKAGSTTTKIVATVGTDYTGGEIAIRNQNWVIEVRAISSVVADSLYLSSALTYINANNRFFIQNIASVLDLDYEWAFSASKDLSIYSAASPSVKVSMFDTLVKVQHKDHITFEGIKFEGGNYTNLMCDTSNAMRIINCAFDNSGAYHIKAVKSDSGLIKRDTLLNSYGSAITFRGSGFVICNDWTVDSNYSKNTGMTEGMGRGADNADQALYILGNNSIITHNRVDSAGYIGIHYIGKKCQVKYNVVSNFCQVKHDGGGVYSWTGTFYAVDFSDSSQVIKNTIYNGGTTSGDIAVGIHMDNLSRRHRLDSNTIFNCKYSCISLHQSNDMIVRNNVLMDGEEGGITQTNIPATSNTIKENFFYTSSPAINIGNSGYAGNFIDSNHYLYTTLSKFKNSSTTYNLASWRTLTGYDAHSDSTLPAGRISDVATLVYNPTGRDSTVSISGLYYDALSVPHNNTIELSPFSSTLLFKADHETPVIANGNLIRINNRKFSFRLKAQ